MQETHVENVIALSKEYEKTHKFVSDKLNEFVWQDSYQCFVRCAVHAYAIFRFICCFLLLLPFILLWFVVIIFCAICKWNELKAKSKVRKKCATRSYNERWNDERFEIKWTTLQYETSKNKPSKNYIKVLLNQDFYIVSLYLCTKIFWLKINVKF